MAGFDPRDTSNRESLSTREVAERFIELFYRQENPRDAFECWMHPDYIQHNPGAPTGRDATLAMMEASILRLRLLKLGGRVQQLRDQVHLRLTSHHPGELLGHLLDTRPRPFVNNPGQIRERT